MRTTTYPRLTSRSRRLLVALLLLGTVACSSGGGDGSSGDGGEAPVTVDEGASNPGDGGFVAASDQAEIDELIASMWASLSAPPCWDSSFIAGSVGSVSQFQFHDDYQYRYVGFSDTYFGYMSLWQIGRYQGYPAAVVTTWTEDTEMIVVVNETTIAHVIWHLDGTPILTYLGANNGPCL